MFAVLCCFRHLNRLEIPRALRLCRFESGSEHFISKSLGRMRLKLFFLWRCPKPRKGIVDPLDPYYGAKGRYELS